MDTRIAPLPNWWDARALVVGLTTSMLAIAIDATAFAQAPLGAQPRTVDSQRPELIYSPWKKFCLKRPDATAQLVCFTGKDGQVEPGQRIAAVLIEPEGGVKKLLRITLPLGTQLPPGTRLIIDQTQPINAPYVICFHDGCMADYEASEELIGNMKRGQRLVVQAVDGQGQAISLPVPLNDFGKAYDGPPSDPKGFEVQSNKVQDELRKSVP